jgi:DNA-binding NarL/FixJ family response regulator
MGAMTRRESKAIGLRTRILIVDDHPVVRLGLKQLLVAEPGFEVCGEAATAAEALRFIDSRDVDLAVVDISLSDGSGIELIKQMTSRDENLRILVVSMHDELLFAERALNAGAHGYVNKDQAPQKLVEAVHRVVQKKIYLSERMADRLLQMLTTKRETGEVTPAAVLSDREMEVFEMISRGLPTREIAETLHLSVKTIETYRENVKRKLKLRTNFELLRSAIEWAQRPK